MSGNEQPRTKKPVYKRWWFWFVIVLFIGVASMEENKSNSILGKMPVTGTLLKYTTQDSCNEAYQDGYNTGKSDILNGKVYDNFFPDDSKKKSAKESRECHLLGYDHGYSGKYPDPHFPTHTVLTPEYMEKICNDSYNQGLLMAEQHRERGMQYDSSLHGKLIPYSDEQRKFFAQINNCYTSGYNKGFYGQ